MEVSKKKTVYLERPQRGCNGKHVHYDRTQLTEPKQYRPMMKQYYIAIKNITCEVLINRTMVTMQKSFKMVLTQTSTLYGEC